MDSKDNAHRSEHDDADSPDETTDPIYFHETADEFAERHVSKFFDGAKGPLDESDETAADNNDANSPLSGDGIIYISGLNRAAHLLASAAMPKNHEARPKQPLELLTRKAEVRLLAEKVLGSREASLRWMEKKMLHALGKRRPSEVMATMEGCDEVEQFLRTLCE